MIALISRLLLIMFLKKPKQLTFKNRNCLFLFRINKAAPFGFYFIFPIKYLGNALLLPLQNENERDFYGLVFSDTEFQKIDNKGSEV